MAFVPERQSPTAGRMSPRRSPDSPRRSSCAKLPPMSVPALKRLDISAFLAFAEGREGKWELFDGVPVAMPPERILHISVKGRAYIALDQAIRVAGLSCSA